MADRRRLGLVVLAVFAVAVAARTIPLYWSPLPATLDGISYAAQARDTLALGHLPVSELRADNLVFVGVLSAAGAILDWRPLTLAQPLVAVVGAASCLAVLAIVVRVGRGLGWRPGRVRVAAVVVGLGLAVEGLYLRRTGVPDEEALGILLLPLLAVGLYRTLRTRRAAWATVTVLVLVVFPLTHTFATLIAALTITGLLSVHVAESRSTRSGFVGLGLVSGFWVYFVAYYEVAPRLGLSVPYLDRVSSYPGLFVAWVIVLVVGAAWVRHAGPRGQRAAFLLPVGLGFLVLVANAVTPVFPGTVASPPLLLAALLLYLVPVAFAVRSVPLVGVDGAHGALLVALLAAPVVHVYFSLTAALTPEFFGTVMRTQTFAHASVFALAALTVAGLLSRAGVDGDGRARVDGGRRHRFGRGVRFLLVLLLAIAIVGTAPIAFVDLDTLEYPSTTTREEFAGASFAATTLDEPWATDHAFSRMAVHYYTTEVAMGPTASWLDGGPSPDCPVLAKRAWTRTGAHFFPASPRTISADRYRAWIERRNLVYATTGNDAVVLTRSRAPGTSGC